VTGACVGAEKLEIGAMSLVQGSRQEIEGLPSPDQSRVDCAEAFGVDGLLDREQELNAARSHVWRIRALVAEEAPVARLAAVPVRSSIRGFGPSRRTR